MSSVRLPVLFHFRKCTLSKAVSTVLCFRENLSRTNNFCRPVGWLDLRRLLHDEISVQILHTTRRNSEERDLEVTALNIVSARNQETAVYHSFQASR
jgi:hypothetical protein